MHPLGLMFRKSWKLVSLDFFCGIFGTSSSIAPHRTLLLEQNPFQQMKFWLNKDSTSQKLNFSIKDLFSICDQIRSLLRIWSHSLKKTLMENFSFCVVTSTTNCYKNMRIVPLGLREVYQVNVNFCITCFFYFCSNMSEIDGKLKIKKNILQIKVDMKKNIPNIEFTLRIR